jgi:hypothetical protein
LADQRGCHPIETGCFAFVQRSAPCPDHKRRLAVELTRFPAHLLLSHRSRFEVGW